MFVEHPTSPKEGEARRQWPGFSCCKRARCLYPPKSAAASLNISIRLRASSEPARTRRNNEMNNARRAAACLRGSPPLPSIFGAQQDS